MYEFHGTQEGTGTHPGQNLDLDYSVTQLFRLEKILQLQAGPIGYALWQTTATTGPVLDSVETEHVTGSTDLASRATWPCRCGSSARDKVCRRVRGPIDIPGVIPPDSVAIDLQISLLQPPTPNEEHMSDTARPADWTKPAAMAIPKEGYFEAAKQGRYGPIFPKTPACYGFTIIAKIKPGREQVFREYGKTIEKAIAGQPDALAVLKLHYLRWVLFDIKGDTYFMYQGIFDTDFDKYTEDAVALFAQVRHQHGLREPRRFPEDWKTNAPAFIKFVREHQCPSFLEYGEYPYVSADEIKKALKLKAAFSTCSTRCSDARGRCHARIRRHPAHPADARAGAHRPLRVPLVSRRRRADAPGWRRSWTRCSRPRRCAASVDTRSAG